MDYPLVLAGLSAGVMAGAAQVGVVLRKKRKRDDELHDSDYAIVVSATLTLLGLLIGFSFSMAISRYDQRKDFEEEEANAIGTEYLRCELMPEAARKEVQAQLLKYIDLRIRRYNLHGSDDVTEVAAETDRVQQQMWAKVRESAAAERDPVSAVIVTGMNDVINRQGYTQAARWKRIPYPAWALMIGIGMFSNFLIGYGEHKPQTFTLLIVPLAIAASFLLIADIDSPQGGVIRVHPQNLTYLADSLKPR